MRIEKGEPDVEDPLRAERRRATDLEGGDGGAGGGWPYGAEKDTDGAEDAGGATSGGVDLDVDSRGVGLKESRVNAEDEALVPDWVGVAGVVGEGAELVVGVRPSDGVSVGAAAGGVEILSGDEVELEKMEREWRWGVGQGSPTAAAGAPHGDGGGGARPRPLLPL